MGISGWAVTRMSDISPICNRHSPIWNIVMTLSTSFICVRILRIGDRRAVMAVAVAVAALYERRSFLESMKYLRHRPPLQSVECLEAIGDFVPTPHPTFG